ncbi:uncharacterized protein LOC123300834 [Chrysoperla carnea]|uniref:uncharacterized protein LOC123300834 n=1 Tax=Chrysoperla carnea TaxID=189513 RepID=UPI001D08BDA6|nr:uncharacterized protein LOC123300834 [Chrysoperla carnea]
MWKRIFGRRVEKSTLSTQTYMEDLNPEEYKSSIQTLIDNNKRKLIKIYEENSKKIATVKSSKVINKKLTENQGSGSSSVIQPEVSECGNQTSTHGTSDYGIQTEGEPPSANLIHCEVGNQTESTNGGRGEVLQRM